MIHPKIEALVASKMLDFMIPADNVANVIDQHTLSTGAFNLNPVQLYHDSGFVSRVEVDGGHLHVHDHQSRHDGRCY